MILKTIVAQRLPKSFEYHGVSAPWLQIRLLKILALLGQDNQTCVRAGPEHTHTHTHRREWKR